MDTNGTGLYPVVIKDKYTDNSLSVTATLNADEAAVVQINEASVVLPLAAVNKLVQLLSMVSSLTATKRTHVLEDEIQTLTLRLYIAEKRIRQFVFKKVYRSTHPPLEHEFLIQPVWNPAMEPMHHPEKMYTTIKFSPYDAEYASQLESLGHGLPIVFEGYSRAEDLASLAQMLVSDMNFRGLTLDRNTNPAIKLDQPILDAIQKRLNQTHETPD
jgi:hypothetical protein